MNDLISRSAIWDALYEADAITMRGAKILNTFPAVDAVEVVRCCKCEYSWFRSAEPYSRYCKHTGLNVGDNDFCSYGERKPDEPD